MRRSIRGAVKLKLVSTWVSWLLQRLRLVNQVSPFFKQSQRTLKEVLDGLTDNKELKAVLAYCWGDYGM